MKLKFIYFQIKLRMNTISSEEITNLVFKTIDIRKLSDLDALNKIRKLQFRYNDRCNGLHI